MRVGDIVELIDENTHDGNFRGRMKVYMIDGEWITCDHPEYDDTYVFGEDELVVMEEADD